MRHLFGTTVPSTASRLGRTFALASALLAAAGAPASAEDELTTLMSDTAVRAEEAKIGFGNGSLIVAPIPLKSPALGDGLIVTGGYLFTFDETSDTSFIGGAALRTSNGSRGAALAARLNFGDGRWSVLTMLGTARANYALYGIGGLRFPPVPLSQEGTFSRLGIGYGLSDTFTLGVDAQYLDTTIRTNGGAPPPLPNLPGPGVGVRQIIAGPTFEVDTRDDTIYPTHGFNGSLVVHHGYGLGSFDNRFTRGTVAAKGYVPVGDRAVFAFAATACRASRDAPFFNMCSVGLTDGLRGYAAGQYIDNALLSAQAEFRVRMGKRIGMVAFAGGSAVGSEFSRLGAPLHAGGAGLRIRLSKDYPLDFSIDRAINGDGVSSTYIYIGQAF